MEPKIRVLAVPFLFALTFLFAAEPVCAVRFSEPVLFQVTRNTTGNVDSPRLRSEQPQELVFSSDGDVLGTSAGHREVYHWIQESGELVRLTTTTGGESYGAARPTDTTKTARPQYVTFVSTGDLDTSVGNTDGNPEIFIRIQNTGEIRQITNTPSSIVNADPYSSDSGRCLVFTSNGDLNENDGTYNPSNSPGTGFSNPDGSEEVFLVEFDTDAHVEEGSITQVSNGPSGVFSARPVIGGYWFPRQCNATVYMSDYDQLGTGVSGIHLYKYRRFNGVNEDLRSKEIETPDRIPPNGLYLNPNISSASNFARGPFVVFHTDADVWHNRSDSQNIFRYRAFHPQMVQITDLQPNEYAANAVISDGGNWIAFESNAELVYKAKSGRPQPPFNADGNSEIFRAQGRRRVQQITNSMACVNDQPSIQDRGHSIAFRSTCDLVPGNNPNGVPQIFFFKSVKRRDPLLEAANCSISLGCCNVANGCYRVLEGEKQKPDKRNCLLKNKC